MGPEGGPLMTKNPLFLLISKGPTNDEEFPVSIIWFSSVLGRVFGAGRGPTDDDDGRFFCFC